VSRPWAPAPDFARRAKGGWTRLAEPKWAIDLPSLTGGRATDLEREAQSVGGYRSFRLIAEPARPSATLEDGTVLTGTSQPGIQFPGAARSGIKVQLERDVRVGRDPTTRLLLDFDAAESFVMRGQRMRYGLLFRPVIRGATR
jgi:hypothetical protein